MSVRTGKPYLGTKTYQVDSKYRVSILPAWRPDPDALVLLQLSAQEGLPVLKVLNQEAYDARVEVLRRAEIPEGVRSAILGALAASCRVGSISDLGKLTIPKDLAEQAQIAPEAEVELVGRDGHFEVWNKNHYQEIKIKEAALREKYVLGVL